MNNNTELIQRLAPYSEATYRTIKNVLFDEKNPNYEYLVVFTGALAGYACHQTVKANNEAFVVIGTVDNKNYYMGANLNAYLLENPYSTLRMMSAAFHHFCPDKNLPDIENIITKVVSKIGYDDYKIADVYSPVDLYKAVKECWVNIYNICITRACKEPTEWSVLFAITMQKILYVATQNNINDAEKLFSIGLESALYISKMDDDSL